MIIVPSNEDACWFGGGVAGWLVSLVLEGAGYYSPPFWWDSSVAWQESLCTGGGLRCTLSFSKEHLLVGTKRFPLSPSVLSLKIAAPELQT